MATTPMLPRLRDGRRWVRKERFPPCSPRAAQRGRRCDCLSFGYAQVLKLWPQQFRRQRVGITPKIIVQLLKHYPSVAQDPSAAGQPFRSGESARKYSHLPPPRPPAANTRTQGPGRIADDLSSKATRGLLENTAVLADGAVGHLESQQQRAKAPGRVGEALAAVRQPPPVCSPRCLTSHTACDPYGSVRQRPVDVLVT
jgi:hypothetical protein